MGNFFSANLKYAAGQFSVSGLDITLQPGDDGWVATVGGGSRTAWAIHADPAEALRLALVELTL